MKYSELPENEKVNAVKDTFISILQDIASDKTKLDAYLKAPVALASGASEEEKAAFEKATKHYAEVQDILAKTVPEPGCICGQCMKFSFDKEVPQALRFLIAEAKKEAQSPEKVYT